MHTDLGAARDLARGVVAEVGDPGEVQVAVCPPFVNLQAVAEVLDGSVVKVGAQHMHFEDQGAYTGEVSADMLTSVGCHYVILGHSERRQYFGETDVSVRKKVRKARAHGLVPIVCVGEKLAQREAGREQEVVRGQVEGALEGVAVNEPDEVVLAYEPVWAIGTGETATPEQAQEMHAFIRSLLRDRFDDDVAGGMHILYGGSMKPHNATSLLSKPDVNGGLIGGASLTAPDFAAIVEAGASV